MKLLPRFVFHGHASSYGGRLYRPKDVIIETGAASALPTVGGLSTSTSKPRRFVPYLSVGAAETLAQGVIDDRKGAIKLTYHQIREDSLSMTTTVSAKVENVWVGPKRLQVALLHGSLESSSPKKDEEPSIRLGKRLEIKGVTIDGYGLTVVLNRDGLGPLDTYQKLVAAPPETFLKGHVPTRAGSTIYTTIVKELRWTKKPHPDAQFDEHTVILPDFGRIIFGELLVSPYARRLTMMRLKLGSPDGGDGEFSEVETNGSWFPPAGGGTP